MSLRFYTEKYARPYTCLTRRDSVTDQRQVVAVYTDSVVAKAEHASCAEANQDTFFELISIATVNEMISVGILPDEARRIGLQYSIPEDK